MKILATSLVAAAALGVGVGCGSTDAGDNSSGNNSGITPAQSAPNSA